MVNTKEMVNTAEVDFFPWYIGDAINKYYKSHNPKSYVKDAAK